MKFQQKCKILHNKKIGTNCYHLKISTPEIALHARPGQFVHIRCKDTLTPLLRRPMSIFNADKNSIEIIYHLIGHGTDALSKRKPGELLDIIGPLGNGFNFPNSSSILLVGGGIGLVPLFYLAKKLSQKKKRIKIFYGARSKKELFLLKYFRSLDNTQIKISTDDGSIGYKGHITELVETYLESISKKTGDLFSLQIYSCGPKPMLIAIKQLVNRYKISCEISLEEYMACGVGACLSCVCKVKDNQYKRVCQDGPVFNANGVIL
ncbi:MAG: dihydroorotate dehydrogenase electron transfer subunit [Candidatus Firestonebacteria bacterium]|nr:dihydroorotate dehydrogenase electron transfer subunit [Candidatus Firestonebacteria bacterium]